MGSENTQSAQTPSEDDENTTCARPSPFASLTASILNKAETEKPSLDRPHNPIIANNYGAQQSIATSSTIEGMSELELYNLLDSLSLTLQGLAHTYLSDNHLK